MGNPYSGPSRFVSQLSSRARRDDLFFKMYYRDYFEKIGRLPKQIRYEELYTYPDVDFTNANSAGSYSRLESHGIWTPTSNNVASIGWNLGRGVRRALFGGVFRMKGTDVGIFMSDTAPTATELAGNSITFRCTPFGANDFVVGSSVAHTYTCPDSGATHDFGMILTYDRETGTAGFYLKMGGGEQWWPIAVRAETAGWNMQYFGLRISQGGTVTIINMICPLILRFE